jgi:malonate transporter
MDNFTFALLPVLVLIVIGYLLKRSAFMSDEAWSGMEKLTYYILFPALLIHTLGNKSVAGMPWKTILIITVVTLVLSAVIMLIWHRLSQSVTGPAFTSIFQGGVRFNTYIGLAVCAAFYGPEGLAICAVAVGFMVVQVNVYCIAVFTVWGENSSGKTSIIRGLIINPLIIGCVIGGLLSVSGIGLPSISNEIMEIVGRAALPFGLLAVGSALRLDEVKSHVKSIAISSVIQFGVKPLTVLALLTAFDISGVVAGALIILFIIPTAPSAYILARQLGGDTETMSSIITFQTLLAFAFMPLIGSLVL